MICLNNQFEHGCDFLKGKKIALTIQPWMIIFFFIVTTRIDILMSMGLSSISFARRLLVLRKFQSTSAILLRKFSCKLENLPPTIISKCDSLFGLKLSADRFAIGSVRNELDANKMALDVAAKKIDGIEEDIQSIKLSISKLEMENIGAKLNSDEKRRLKQMLETAQQLRDALKRLQMNEASLKDESKQLRNDEKRHMKSLTDKISEKLPEHVESYIKWSLERNVRSSAMERRPSSSSTNFDFAKYNLDSQALLVDKTGLFKHLFTKQRVVYLRPRRFGKSLILSTLKYFFYGATHLFEQTKIYKESISMAQHRWCPNSEVEHNFPPCPVLHFDFSARRCKSADDFQEFLLSEVTRIGKLYCIPSSEFLLSGSNISASLGLLIDAICDSKWNKWKQVVVLVDEYDAFLNRWVTEVNDAEKKKGSEILKDFFSLIKSRDSSILFAYVTGITSFGMASLYSGANNFVNLSYDSKLHSLCGFTQEEVQELLGASEDELEPLKKYYNGYSFTLDGGICGDKKSFRVFNPYAIARYFDARKLMPYWVASSSESLLTYFPHITKLVLALPYPVSVSSLQAHVDYLSRSRGDLSSLAKLLFESGYLTIKGFDRDSNALLDFPNQEISNHLLSEFREHILPMGTAGCRREIVKDGINSHDDLLPLLKFANECRMMGSFYRKKLFNSEAMWHELLSMTLFCLGDMNFACEQSNAMGRSDILLLSKTGTLFIIELKLLNKEDAEKDIRKEKAKLLAEVGIAQALEKQHDESIFINSNEGKIKSVQYVAAVAANRKDMRQMFYVLQRPKDGGTDKAFYF